MAFVTGDRVQITDGFCRGWFGVVVRPAGYTDSGAPLYAVDVEANRRRLMREDWLIAAPEKNA